MIFKYKIIFLNLLKIRDLINIKLDISNKNFKFVKFMLQKLWRMTRRYTLIVTSMIVSVFLAMTNTQILPEYRIDLQERTRGSYTC